MPGPHVALPALLVAWVLGPAAAAPSEGSEHAGGAGPPESHQMSESDVYLGSEHFTANESSNLGVIYKWLDDVMWTELWDSGKNRRVVYDQLEQLARLSTDHFPSMTFAVAQALYSYFWFKDNGPEVDLRAALRSIDLHELTLNQSGCRDLTMAVGSFLSKACAERWFYTIMLCTEVGIELAASRTDVGRSASLLGKADELFHELNSYSFFNFRRWKSLYDINTNSHVFPELVGQRPIWPNEALPIAGWLEENFQVFKDDLDSIIENNLFDTLYFAGHVSMTQFGPKRESWAPLNLIHNRKLAPHACQVANRTCELLLTRPEIAECDAKDAGAAFARLLPGMGIKPHFWNAPPRLGVHLGIYTPPGASMYVGEHRVEWQEGKAVVFDDTYIHSVRHKGTETRYLLIAWFCHPCDNVHTASPQGLCLQ